MKDFSGVSFTICVCIDLTFFMLTLQKVVFTVFCLFFGGTYICIQYVLSPIRLGVDLYTSTCYSRIFFTSRSCYFWYRLSLRTSSILLRYNHAEIELSPCIHPHSLYKFGEFAFRMYSFELKIRWLEHNLYTYEINT